MFVEREPVGHSCDVVADYAFDGGLMACNALLHRGGKLGRPADILGEEIG